MECILILNVENSNSNKKKKKINKYFLLFINKLYIIFIINNNLYLNTKINKGIGPNRQFNHN